jgi:hypothetical protein
MTVSHSLPSSKLPNSNLNPLPTHKKNFHQNINKFIAYQLAESNHK